MDALLAQPAGTRFSSSLTDSTYYTLWFDWGGSLLFQEFYASLQPLYTDIHLFQRAIFMQTVLLLHQASLWFTTRGTFCRCHSNACSFGITCKEVESVRFLLSLSRRTTCNEKFSEFGVIKELPGSELLFQLTHFWKKMVLFSTYVYLFAIYLLTCVGGFL